jgi:hypothetical protein
VGIEEKKMLGCVAEVFFGVFLSIFLEVNSLSLGSAWKKADSEVKETRQP